MNDCVYEHLIAAPWSRYKGLFIKDPRKLRAEWIYRETIGEEQRTPEQVAADYQLPVAAVREAIHYCTHNEELLRRERECEQTRIAEIEAKHPALQPPAPTA